MRIALIIAGLLAATTAQAQNTTTITPPGIETYTLPPGNSQTAPTPSPTLTSTPLPSVVPILAVPRATPVPTPTRVVPTVRPTPTPTPSPTPARTEAAPMAATPSPVPSVDASSVASPTPQASATPVVPAAAQNPSALPTWLWWLVGAAVIAAVAAMMLRRSASQRAEAIPYAPEPAAPPPAGPPAALPTPSAPAKTAAPMPPSTQAIVLDLRPQRLWTLGPDAHLAFELVVTNSSTVPADAVRPVIALASAGPDTAAEIATFHASAQTLPGGEPFALRPGETRIVAGELIVPVVLVSLHWRAGLSLARASEAFVVGTGDTTTPRLGPIWVDRAGLVYAKLDARRFTPGPR